MDGNTIQKFFSNEVRSMLSVFTNFESLIPGSKSKGSDHRGEDGRFVETLIRDLLAKYLPKELEVLTGFIVKPAVKRDTDTSRKKDQDTHSTQLDIIIYDTAHYPVFMRYGDTALVPPEGVICIISVKKKLRAQSIADEIIALKEAARLCIDDKHQLRPPYLALLSIESDISKQRTETLSWIFQQMKTTYENSAVNDDRFAFDETVGYIGAINEWSIFKKRPKMNKLCKAQYIAFRHDDEAYYHLSLQFLLTGILSVYYDKSRNPMSRPGFTAFPSNLKSIKTLGDIETKRPAFIAR